MSLTQSQLFDPEFLTAVHRLQLQARRVPRGGTFAEQRAQQMGAGIEFRDYRGYVPGDDLRAIDWNIYQRLGRVFLRLFEEQSDLPVYLAPDVSSSMWQTERPRAHAGLRCAFALAAIALAHRDSVGLMPFSDRLDIVLQAGNGRARLPRMARLLAELEPGGQTDFVASLGRLSRMSMRPGLLVVISDFFDPNGVDAVVAALQRQRHRLLLVQLVRASDAEPVLTGELLLRDCETGEEQQVSVGKELLAAYRDSYRTFNERLRAFADSRRAGLLRIDVDQPIVPQFGALFANGVYRV